MSLMADDRPRFRVNRERRMFGFGIAWHRDEFYIVLGPFVVGWLYG